MALSGFPVLTNFTTIRFFHPQACTCSPIQSPSPLSSLPSMPQEQTKLQACSKHSGRSTWKQDKSWRWAPTVAGVRTASKFIYKSGRDNKFDIINNAPDAPSSLTLTMVSILNLLAEAGHVWDSVQIEVFVCVLELANVGGKIKESQSLFNLTLILHIQNIFDFSVNFLAMVFLELAG